MPVKSQNFMTLCYDNYPEQKEFVFAIKGRPFSMLSTQKLPVPSTSLNDYKLVKDLDLKMDDLQCSKFTFGGQKFRILGKISQTVQTIKNGTTSGTIHLRASVVENLSEVFDSHSIAGKKMTEMLIKKEPASCPSSSKSKVRKSTSAPSSPSSTPALLSSPSPVSTPSRPRSPWCLPAVVSTPSPPRSPWCIPAVVPSPSPTRSPPGFPVHPQYTRPEPRYGRVIQKTRLQPFVYDVLSYAEDGDEDTDPLLEFICEDQVACGVQVNDVVAFNICSPREMPVISQVYTEYASNYLGLDVPDCPPEYLPSGYYG